MVHVLRFTKNVVKKLQFTPPPVACVPDEDGLVLEVVDDDVAISGALVLIELDVEGSILFMLSLPSAIPSPSTTPSITNSAASLPLALV